MISTEGQSKVLENLNRKTIAAERMFQNLVELMASELKVDFKREFKTKIKLPSFLKN